MQGIINLIVMIANRFIIFYDISKIKMLPMLFLNIKNMHLRKLLVIK